MSEPTTDDIYAYAVSKTLTKISSPATVGLYSACQNRLSMILDQIEVNMNREALRIEQEHDPRSRPRPLKQSSFLALIWRMIFYRPVWSSENQHQRNIRFIYVDFSAWHFAGSDLLWAGIAIRLFQAMQLNFGKLQLALFRVAQYDEEDEVKREPVERGPKNWKPKMLCCCPLWLFVLCLLVLPLIILVFLLTADIPTSHINSTQGMNGTKGQVGVLEGMVIAALGVPAASGLRFVLSMLKNLIFSQELNMKKGMDNERVSSQLGFMNEVRKEMWFLSHFIQFMEVFEGRRIRVVLRITCLDRCSPKKIVSVLNAVNILLSDEESPFISFLAVDPGVLVQKVNFADGCFCKEERGHALLGRITTLAFTVPPLCDDSKNSLLHSMAAKLSTSKKVTNRSRYEKSSSFSDEHRMEVAVPELCPLVNQKAVEFNVKDKDVEDWLCNVLSSKDRKLNKYISDDNMFMRRVINSMRVTLIIMKASKMEIPHSPEYTAAWVVLANQWPCRLSWIIQCVEDSQQRAETRHTDVLDDATTLWKVFSESRAELYVMSVQIEDLLEQDGDPELFERLLLVDFPFTVKDLTTFKMATVNLDQTIKAELAQIRGTNRLKDSGWMRDLAPLPMTTIMKMDTEDVCTELERMKFAAKYVDIVRNNSLSGSALIFGDVDDLKRLLAMNFGEWASFRLHFLGLPAHLQPQQKRPWLTRSSPANQVSGLNQQMIHQHSSNRSLASS